MCNPWSQRRTLLKGVRSDATCARLADVFDDGRRSSTPVVSYGLEGIVAKRHTSLYRSGYGGWTKVKNSGYWRRDSEIDSLRVARRSSVAAWSAFVAAPTASAIFRTAASRDSIRPTSCAITTVVEDVHLRGSPLGKRLDLLNQRIVKRRHHGSRLTFLAERKRAKSYGPVTTSRDPTRAWRRASTIPARGERRGP